MPQAKVRLTFLLMQWQPISTAPYEVDLEIAVLDKEGTHKLVFPCHRIPGGWVKAGTNQWVEVHPTHWREWEGGPSTTS
jgi:hypothetical protein